MALPELVAHRGYRLRFPENTLLAVHAAINAGARYVEVDIQLTRDLVPVLFHDATLDRLCGVNGKIYEAPLSQIKQLHAYEYERFGYRYADARVPTLTEFVDLLKQHPDVTVFVELKRESLEHFGIEPVLAQVLPLLNDIRTRAVLISYELDALLAVRQRGWPSIGAVLKRWRDRHSAMVRALSPQFIFADVDDLPRFGRLRTSAPQLVVFEVADPKLALRLARRGAHLIETFAFAELKRALDSNA
jgi:glycerophosphoryl diester phosphodiesterase